MIERVARHFYGMLYRLPDVLDPISDFAYRLNWLWLALLVAFFAYVLLEPGLTPPAAGSTTPTAWLASNGATPAPVVPEVAPAPAAGPISSLATPESLAPAAGSATTESAASLPARATPAEPLAAPATSLTAARPADLPAADTPAVTAPPAATPNSFDTALHAVVAVAVNLRTRPGTSTPIVESLPVGTALTLVARDAGGEWLLVTTPGGRQGWVHTRFLHVTGDVRALPLRPTSAIGARTLATACVRFVYSVG